MQTLASATLYEAISEMSGIPVEELADAGSLLRRLPQIEIELRRRLIGQGTAVDSIMASLRSRLLRSAATRPVLSLLCVGPSGVGKTETALQLARVCLGSPEAIIRLDGSEFREPHSISRLIGSPPGYVGHGTGGQLTEAVRRRARLVVLFDEVEKAHQDVLNTLLQVMSAGRLTDAMSQTVDFRRAMVVLTSNLGNKLEDGAAEPDRLTYERQVKDAVRAGLPPEFLGRLDAVVVYHHLDRQALQSVVRLKLEGLARATHGVASFEASNEAVRQLAEEAWSPDSGARQVDRVLQRRVDPALIQMTECGMLDLRHPALVTIGYDGDYVFDRGKASRP